MSYGHLKPQKPSQRYVPRVFGFKLHKPWQWSWAARWIEFHCVWKIFRMQQVLPYPNCLENIYNGLSHCSCCFIVIFELLRNCNFLWLIINFHATICQVSHLCITFFFLTIYLFANKCKLKYLDGSLPWYQTLIIISIAYISVGIDVWFIFPWSNLTWRLYLCNWLLYSSVMQA